MGNCTVPIDRRRGDTPVEDRITLPCAGCGDPITGVRSGDNYLMGVRNHTRIMGVNINGGWYHYARAACKEKALEAKP